jgi:predicted Zn-dependent protease
MAKMKSAVIEAKRKQWIRENPFSEWRISECRNSSESKKRMKGNQKFECKCWRIKEINLVYIRKNMCVDMLVSERERERERNSIPETKA